MSNDNHMADNNSNNNVQTNNTQTVVATPAASTWVTVNTSTSANVASMEFTKSLDYDLVFKRDH